MSGSSPVAVASAWSSPAGAGSAGAAAGSAGVGVGGSSGVEGGGAGSSPSSVACGSSRGAANAVAASGASAGAKRRKAMRRSLRNTSEYEAPPRPNQMNRKENLRLLISVRRRRRHDERCRPCRRSARGGSATQDVEELTRVEPAGRDLVHVPPAGARRLRLHDALREAEERHFVAG